ncbi:2',5'-phosphodiesterase 12-like [Bolinopsis microptera]|uniref:2',5'-phosphodiesterase 12-like n=1 Tax=Bolinopsis microptera TaxID=2820187 RepID=UPI003079257E
MLDLIDLGNHKESKKLVIVGNTHLYWNPEYHIIALFHIHALCSKIQTVREVYQKQGEGVSVVICGDMNSQTTSLVNAYLTDGVVSQVENGDELQNFLHKNVRNPLKLTLARGEPNYTNYTADFKDVIDYIVCDENSTVGHVTPSPNLSDLEESEGCRSAIFPSDHLPIISDILYLYITWRY